ncbi:MAG: GxxExxY protein [Planctomycetaceae bacterium]
MYDGIHSDLTGRIIKAFYTVYSELGYGFNESVYERSLLFELRRAGLDAQSQFEIPVFYCGLPVGNYKADIVVNGSVLLELKSTVGIAKEHEAQVLNYLKATRIEVGLLFNFGPEPQLKRFVLDNHRKGSLSWTQQIEVRGGDTDDTENTDLKA